MHLNGARVYPPRLSARPPCAQGGLFLSVGFMRAERFMSRRFWFGRAVAGREALSGDARKRSSMTSGLGWRHPCRHTPPIGPPDRPPDRSRPERHEDQKPKLKAACRLPLTAYRLPHAACPIGESKAATCCSRSVIGEARAFQPTGFRGLLPPTGGGRCPTGGGGSFPIRLIETVGRAGGRPWRGLVATWMSPLEPEVMDDRFRRPPPRPAPRPPRDSNQAAKTPRA